MLYSVGDMLLNSATNQIYRVVSVDLYSQVYTFEDQADMKILCLHASTEYWLDYYHAVNTPQIWEDLNG